MVVTLHVSLLTIGCHFRVSLHEKFNMSPCSDVMEAGVLNEFVAGFSMQSRHDEVK